VEHGRYETAESPQPSRVAAGLLLSAVRQEISMDSGGRQVPSSSGECEQCHVYVDSSRMGNWKLQAE